MNSLQISFILKLVLPQGLILGPLLLLMYLIDLLARLTLVRL